MFSGLFLLLAAVPAALAADVRGTLVGNHLLNSTVLPIDAYVDVDYGVARAPITADGSFFLSTLSPGQHVVRPIVRGFKMTDRLLTVPETVVTEKTESETDSEEQGKRAGEVHVQVFVEGRQPQAVSKVASLGLPLEIGALIREEYYAPPAGMNILQMLKSPMVLMVLFSGVMAVAMPYMTANMESDPELAREMAAQRKRMADGMGMNKDWSGALAARLAGEKNEGGAAGGSSGSSSPGPGGVSAGGAGGTRTPTAGGGSGGGRGGKRGGKRK